MEYCPPPTCLHMALTCTTLHHQCQKHLDLHQEAYAKYRITSDLSPETVVDLLKDTTKTKIERWHVRELEIWGSRYDWEDWRPWVPKLPGTCDLADGSPTRRGLDLQDIGRYIETSLDLWTYPRFDTEAIQWGLEDGQDGFLKLILIATCPRLHSLRFVKNDIDRHTTLKWMRKVINECRRARNGPHDLHGFESLRHIAVSIETGQCLWNNTCFHRDARDFAALFYIPNLESLYFNDLHYIADGDEYYLHCDVVDQYHFPRGTSSVKHLFIDGASGFSADYYQAIANTSRSSPDAEQLAEYVSDSFPASAEALYFWGRSDEHVDDSASDDIPSDILDSTLAALIESGVLQNLKAVYLADVEKRQARNDADSPLRRSIDAGLKELVLPKSVAAGLKTGVHVCTVMNRDDGGYWKNFPARPDRFDLKTGPCYGERPASWRLNLQSGEWGSGCEGCGECRNCLAMYPAELWKSGRS
ncbi:hypothetical protein FPHYL_1746 [Fusarium phyllophilum]|uniref:Uncharacterized protein n=1 Tax=Fusarium phyllophilum TaxID=47803 RepID=A0A8H5K9A6_9HYPO|nr:hypothetical protein FPHYL_1746 [Fusarium phyllophilum]